jgi:hypothetical protein
MKSSYRPSEVVGGRGEFQRGNVWSLSIRTEIGVRKRRAVAKSQINLVAAISKSACKLNESNTMFNP